MTDGNSNRRDFLKASTAATAGLGLLTNAHAAAKNETLKVGVVGCGGRGTGAAENICEAAGTSFNVKIHALADAFADNLEHCRENLAKRPAVQGKLDVSDDRCFVGFDAFQKVIDCCDLIILATPPGFRPQHIEAVVKAGKHLFTEKPVAVDPVGIRKVLAAHDEAVKKKLHIIAGTQRRHEASYLEAMKRIHDGAIGRITSARVYWNQGDIWARKRKPEWKTEMDYQVRNWYHFLWLCGDHIVEQHVHNLDVAVWAIGALPVRAVGMGGRQVHNEPEWGENYDHFAIDYEFPNGVHVMSMCRQISGCENNVSETITGSDGEWTSINQRFSGKNKGRIKIKNEPNPYVQEHVDLLQSIYDDKPVCELKQVAESTLVAIMGRTSAYTGKAVSWDAILNSKLDTFPEKLEWGPRPALVVPRPGVTELI